MKTLTQRQHEIIRKIKEDRALNPDRRTPQEWLLDRRTKMRLADLTKILNTSTETLYALFNFFRIESPKKGGRFVKTGYVNKDLEETKRLLSMVRGGGKRAERARERLLRKGIRYYSASEAAKTLGIR